jgi:hypothetical protein
MVGDDPSVVNKFRPLLTPPIFLISSAALHSGACIGSHYFNFSVGFILPFI